MAYQIIGIIHRIGAVENIPTKDGGTLSKRTLVLMQKRYDQYTGQEYAPNYPTLEFTNKSVSLLDNFQQGMAVKVTFEVNGYKYNDKQTGEEKYSSSIRGFKIEPYVAQQPQYAPQPAPQPQYQQQYYQQAPQQYPQGQYGTQRNDDPPF